MNEKTFGQSIAQKQFVNHPKYELQFIHLGVI